MAVNGNGATRYNTAVPSVASPTVFNVADFQITTQKLPILKAAPIDDMTQKIGIQIPEMIFGDNIVAVAHKSGWCIKFDAFGALDSVDKTGEKRLKVAYSQEWHKSRQDAHDFKKLEEVKPFDWSYTPQDYRGEVVGENVPQFTETTRQIPVELLKRPDPILFFDDVILYEDELADNGIAMLNVKIRVMPARLLLLSRFFMRLDDVMIRVRDTRIYVEFETGEVIREYVEKEKEYDKVKADLAHLRDDVSAAMRDPNQMAEALPVVRRFIDEVKLPR